MSNRIYFIITKMNTLRYYQEECIQAMRDAEEKFSIYQLFCGTGKTNIFTTYLEEEKLGVVIMAFPRISLVHQYNMDYYETRDELRANYKHYCVSSDHDSKEKLVEFTKSSTGGRLILTTHTSFLEVCNILLDEGVEIDTIILDEIHHFGSKKKMDKLEDLDVGKIFGFTATPANRLQQEKIEYQYGYSEALRDNYCKPFEVDLYVTEDEKNPENLYKGLFYLAEKTRVNNILCFHAFSEVDGKQGKSSVSQYKNITTRVDFANTYFTDGIKSHTITGKMSNPKRLAALNAVSNAKAKQLNILHSCNTISEGIDTKAIKSICFPDAKGSTKAIIQSIGRITRLDPTTDDPSRVFIPFFEVTRDGIIEGDFEEEEFSDESDEDLEENCGDERLSGDTLVNETAYRTILGIIEFLKADNAELFNAALENPNILTKEEYEFHFAKVIVNKGGDMYVGKTLDEIRERNVMVCTTDKDGDILTLGDFLDDKKTVTKETGVDEWIYLYVDAETEVVKANLGRGKRAIGATTRKPRKLVVFGDPDDAKVVLGVARGKKNRLDKINDFIEGVRENKKLPVGKEEHGGFFTTLKSTANGTSKSSAPLSTEEINTLEKGLKTKDWASLTDETFQRHVMEFLDPEVEWVDYVVVTRLVKINDFIEGVRENKKLPIWGEEHNLFFATLKKITNGKAKGSAPLSAEEINTLEKGLKTKEWASLTDETFQRHVMEFLDPEVEWVDYVVVTRLVKINNLLDWVRENKKLPFYKEDHDRFFAKLKSIANGKAKGSAPLSTEEVNVLATGLKTKEWASLTDKVFQKKIKEFLDPEVEWIDYNAAPKAVPNTAQAPAPVAEPKAAPSRYAANSLTSVKSFVENGNIADRKKLVALQSLKSGTRKTGTLYPEVEEYLTELDVEWWKKKPEELRGATTAAPTTATTTVVPQAAPTTTTATSAVDIILDYDDALSSGEELSSQLKKDLRALYREKNSRLLKFIENRKITAEEFLDHVV